MERNSVRSGRNLHIPVSYEGRPVPLCSLFVAGETPSWSMLMPNCKVCERIKRNQDNMLLKKPQLVLDAG